MYAIVKLFLVVLVAAFVAAQGYGGSSGGYGGESRGYGGGEGYGYAKAVSYQNNNLRSYHPVKVEIPVQKAYGGYEQESRGYGGYHH